MKQMGVVFFAFLIILVSASAGLASAAEVSITQKIRVQARVQDTHYIVVDANDKILQITSNTDKDVVPRVYRTKIARDSEIPLEAKVYRSYRLIVGEGESRPGVLYIYYPIPLLANMSRLTVVLPRIASL